MFMIVIEEKMMKRYRPASASHNLTTKYCSLNEIVQPSDAARGTGGYVC